MSELSQTDNRVIAHLRVCRRRTSEIARNCFQTTNVRPAAAHLARMKERGLVTREGNFWILTPTAANPSPELPL
jgi:hypothetical protein